jgi:RNA polymerase sigma-70 factor (ECF subfamily)
VDKLTDEELMAAVRAGDIAAFEAIVERYKRMVYSMAYGMLRSREDAEEAAQDTFVKLFRAREQFDPERRLEPWLLRIAGNTCRDVLRRRKTDKLPTLGGDDNQSLVEAIADPLSLGRDLAEASRNAVRQELSRLSDALRLPLVLKYLNGFTNHQVADALGISVSNVKVRAARAKDLLQSRLAERMERS